MAAVPGVSTAKVGRFIGLAISGEEQLADALSLLADRHDRDADIRDMQIWRFGTRLFMIMETGPNFSPEAKAAADLASEDVQAWERLMWEFQQPLAGAADGEKWVAMKQIFAKSDQP